MPPYKLESMNYSGNVFFICCCRVHDYSAVAGSISVIDNNYGNSPLKDEEIETSNEAEHHQRNEQKLELEFQSLSVVYLNSVA